MVKNHAFHRDFIQLRLSNFDLIYFKKWVEIYDWHVIYGEFNNLKKQDNLGVWKWLWILHVTSNVLPPTLKALLHWFFFLLNYDTWYWNNIAYDSNTAIEHKNQSGTKVIAIFNTYANIFLLLHVYIFFFHSPSFNFERPCIFLSLFQVYQQGQDLFWSSRQSSKWMWQRIWWKYKTAA